MRRWFLSYTSQDFALTQALKAALQRKDPDADIFFAPESMRAGGFWKKQLAEEIEVSTAFILLVGEKGLGDWQVIEYYEALDRRAKEPSYPIILVLSAKRPAPGLPFARQLHWVLTEDPASEATIGKLLDATSGPAERPGELWRFTRPYRGLEAMTEANSDYFFGRWRETVDVVTALASERGKLPILLGNSGVGKSSLAQAGVLAALLRQGWPEQKDTGRWPIVFDLSRHWCFLTLRPGAEPVRALVEPFIRAWQFDATDPRREERLNEWTDRLCGGTASLRGLLDATQDRLSELGQSTPPSFFLYVDQGEELYVRSGKQQRHRFSEIVADGLADSRLRALMSLRADLFGELQKDAALFAIHRLINVAPLREAELHEVVSAPAKLLSAQFQTGTLPADIARRTAEESSEDAGALPLLSYLLDDMWSDMVQRGDGVLRLPTQAIDLGAVLVARANKFLAEHPDAQDSVRRILTLKLATVREDSEPTRRRALRSEFSEDEWKLVSELADHPNRLLVTVAPEGSETYAEVAHEAIFRRWGTLRDWIAAEREFLAWRTGLEAARRAWQATPDDLKGEALLLGLALAQAQGWLGQRRGDLSESDRGFIDSSLNRAESERQREEERKRRELEWAAQVDLLRERASGARRLKAAVIILAIFFGAASLFWFKADSAQQIAATNYDAAKGAVSDLVFVVTQALQNIEGIRVQTVQSVLAIVDKTIRKVEAVSANDPEISRIRAELLFQTAKAFQKKEEHAEAVRAAAESLVIRSTLTHFDQGQSNPQLFLSAPALWRWELSQSLEFVGDLFYAETRYQDARERLQSALAIRQQLVSENKENEDWALGVSRVYLRLGDIDIYSDLPTALRNYENSLTIAAKYFQSKPDSILWQRELAWNFNKMGDVRLRRADLTSSGDSASRSMDISAALRAFNNALCLRRQISARDEANTDLKRDVPFILDRVGDAKLRLGDETGAEVAYFESLSIRRSLVQSVPDAVLYLADMGRSLAVIGEYFSSRNNVKNALAFYEAAVDTWLQATVLSPREDRLRQMLVRTQKKAADLRKQFAATYPQEDISSQGWWTKVLNDLEEKNTARRRALPDETNSCFDRVVEAVNEINLAVGSPIRP
jgi:TIR domain